MKKMKLMHASIVFMVLFFGAIEVFADGPLETCRKHSASKIFQPEDNFWKGTGFFATCFDGSGDYSDPIGFQITLTVNPDHSTPAHISGLRLFAVREDQSSHELMLVRRNNLTNPPYDTIIDPGETMELLYFAPPEDLNSTVKLYFQGVKGGKLYLVPVSEESGQIK